MLLPYKKCYICNTKIQNLKDKIIKIIKIIVFITFGILLFYLVYKDFDFSSLQGLLLNLNYWFFVLAFLICIISHVLRTVRWQMLIDDKENKTTFFSVFIAVLNGYLVNLAIPRAGEISRCALVSQYNNSPFSKVVGTVVSERAVDIILMLLFTVLAFFLQTTEVEALISNNPVLYENLQKLANIKYILIISISLIIIGILFILIIKGKFNRFKIFIKIQSFVKGLWYGMISVKDVRNPFLFILYSVGIWVCYFLEFYLCFFAFGGDIANLNFLVALTTFMACSYGMLAPSPNGLGAYHFMVIQTLIVYSVAENDATSFALIAHGMQTIFIIVLGIFSVIAIPFLKKQKKYSTVQKN